MFVFLVSEKGIGPFFPLSFFFCKSENFCYSVTIQRVSGDFKTLILGHLHFLMCSSCTLQASIRKVFSLVHCVLGEFKELFKLFRIFKLFFVQTNGVKKNKKTKCLYLKAYLRCFQGAKHYFLHLNSISSDFLNVL